MKGAESFGTRLRALRERVGLTQKQLAERAGLHPQGVVKLERGEREPAWTTVLALADALGVNCLAFVEQSDPSPSAAPKSPKRGRPLKRKKKQPNQKRTNLKR